MISRQKISIILLIIYTLILILVWAVRAKKNSSPIPSSGGGNLSITNNPTPPTFLQNDDQWKNEIIGETSETIGNVGCTLCCVTMSLSHLGYQISPRELNDQLSSINGYTESGWLKWKSVKKLYKEIEISIPRNPSYKVIDNALTSNTPVIAKILLHDYISHWVLIVGKNKFEYIILDPLNKDRSFQVLSDLSKNIQSIRVIQ